MTAAAQCEAWPGSRKVVARAQSPEKAATETGSGSLERQWPSSGKLWEEMRFETETGMQSTNAFLVHSPYPCRRLLSSEKPRVFEGDCCFLKESPPGGAPLQALRLRAGSRSLSRCQKYFAILQLQPERLLILICTSGLCGLCFVKVSESCPMTFEYLKKGLASNPGRVTSNRYADKR